MRSIAVTMMVVSVVVVGGCAETKQCRSGEPVAMVGDRDYAGVSRQTSCAMSDNAVLADMTLADIHFVPRIAELNSLGRDRLAQCIAVLERYGGEVRYDPQVADEMLIKGRLEVIEVALANAGLDMSTVSVKTAMSSSPGMSGKDAARAASGSRSVVAPSGGMTLMQGAN